MDRGSTDIDGSFVPGAETERRRIPFYPRGERTLVVCVRLPEAVYDACIARASRSNVPVRSVMRRAISEYVTRR